LRNTFAVAQIALAVALVIGAALMSKGIVAMMHSADRYDPSHKLIFTVHLPQAQYSTPVVRSIWYKHSLDRLREIPGVKQAELSNALPLSDQGWQDGFEIENRPREPGRFQTAFRIPVSPGYFTAFHIPIIAGRGFAQSDDLGSKFVAIVSRRFAAQNFPDADPIGHRIRLGVGSKDLTPWITIIGVTEDADYNLFLRVNAGTVYLNVAQLPPVDETYSLVTDGNASAVAPMARKALAQIDEGLPLDDLEDYAQFMHEKLIGLDYVAALLGTDAVIALLLAAIGIFGVMANLVAERTREIGVRLALGARREDVLLIILRRASILMTCGLGFGLVGAFALARGVASLLYGVSPNDALVFGVTTASIAAIALLSSWIPARRAAAIDPIIALRDE
jgi:putative ABC transport system permease protein